MLKIDEVTVLIETEPEIEVLASYDRDSGEMSYYSIQYTPELGDFVAVRRERWGEIVEKLTFSDFKEIRKVKPMLIVSK